MTYFLFSPSGKVRFVLLSLRRSVATAANSREGGFLQSTYSVLTRWDISLTLNMTYFFIRHSERSEESHNLSEEYILCTFSVGYFANAQYDVLFAFPEGESEVGFTVFAREHSDRGNLPGGCRSTM